MSTHASGPPEITSSPIVRRETPASRQRVWNVLADGWTYSQWVVGNSRMRAVDPKWPQPASVIHHSIGIWPAVINDRTVVESCTPEYELVLIAKGGPLGTARVTLRLHDIEGGGCLIEMAEVPVSPPLSWLPDSAALAMAYPRNRESTWRLVALAERRPTADD
ncbi:SRPBCC family protein [Mycobacterium sp. 4D054]|uniref:SRPBCC family protein n=1 Tax=Mycobacterium sp. 4D054 TaxID=3457440 RepID=UPI003FD017F5